MTELVCPDRRVDTTGLCPLNPGAAVHGQHGKGLAATDLTSSRPPALMVISTPAAASLAVSALIDCPTTTPALLFTSASLFATDGSDTKEAPDCRTTQLFARMAPRCPAHAW